MCVTGPMDYKDALPPWMETLGFVHRLCLDFLHVELRGWELWCDDNQDASKKSLM